MARASPPVPRGEPAAATRNHGFARTPRDLARRLVALRWLGRGFHALALAVTLGVVALILALIGVVGSGAGQSIFRFGPRFLTSTDWNGVTNVYGAGPAIAGTLLTSALALLIAVPIALGAAVFLSEVAPGWLRRPLTYTIDLSAAVPSVVYGFWAFIVLVPLMQSVIEPGLAALTGGGYPFSYNSPGTDLFTATIVLAVMIVPTIAAVARESLRAVPRIHRESGLSLGATRWEATRLGVLRAAQPGIVAGIILGLGRALGETIAVTMVIGNIYILPGTLFSKGATLASTIVNNFPGEPGLNRSAIMELALLLLIITFGVNVLARGLLGRFWRGGEEDGAPARKRGGFARLWTRSHSEPRAALPSPEAPATAVPAWRLRVVQEAPRRIRRRRVVQLVVLSLAAFAVVLALLPFASVIYTAVQYGGSAVVQPSFYTSPAPQGCNPKPGVTCSLGGIGPEIQGTLIMLGLAALIAVPVGLLAGIYLAEYGRHRIARAVSLVADVMTGVPSVIVAVFVFAVFLYFDHNSTLSALSAGVGLGVLMIPIAMRGTEEALRAVPNHLRESALALGFPRHRVTARVVLGCARGGLVTGMLLALSRAAGDTAIPLFLAGGSSFWIQGFGTPTAAMTPFIFNNFGSSYGNLQTDAWGAALVLLGIMLAIGIVARLVAPASRDAAEAG